jgi:glycosyltransferase involved in cell wall biosynthesis/tetratricopeptide (TPR) repeat protein
MRHQGRTVLAKILKSGARSVPADAVQGQCPQRGTADVGGLVERAEEAQRERQWTRAHELWLAAVQAAPDNAGYWLQVGNMRNELGRHTEAIAAFRSAEALDPDAAEPLAGVAGVHERAGAWRSALDIWLALARMLQDRARAPRERDAEALAHALSHAALSASMLGQRELTQDLLAEAGWAASGTEPKPEQLLLRAQAIRPASPARAIELLRRCLELMPDSDAAAYELAAASLETGDYGEAIGAIEPAAMRRPEDVSFLWLLADLCERTGRWRDVRELSERMGALEPFDPRHLRRAVRAAVHGRDLGAARRLAREFASAFSGELSELHALAEAYAANSETDRARLLMRFMRRRWGHSVWHAARYAVLAAHRSQVEADKILRAEVLKRGRSIDLDWAYCQAAAARGNHAETRRRLKWFVREHPADEGAKAFLGYAIANTSGIDPAEAHFARLASETFQSRSALVGLAHMAMRRRDAAATRDRWAAVVELYPEEATAWVEYARGLYETRDAEAALRVCGERLRRAPGDVAAAEFHAWLLVALGRFQDAWAFLGPLKERTGPGWAGVDVAIQSGSRLGQLDAGIETVLGFVPAGGTREDAHRLYHAVRHLVCARRADLIGQLVSRAIIVPAGTPWLMPYLRFSDAALAPSVRDGVGFAWSKASAVVRSDVAESVRGAGEAEISALLARPPYEQPTIHVVNRFEQPRGGSELHALDLAERLRRHTKVSLWASETPHPDLRGDANIKTIDPGGGQIPRGGTVIVIGVYFDVSTWIGMARPERVIFLYNTFEAPRLFEQLRRVYAESGVRPELLYCSDMMGEETGLPGHFEPSPVDIELFRPVGGVAPGAAAGAEGAFLARPFTLGRHSRDVMEKHNPEDWRVYRAVAEAGGRSRLLGGTCMRPVVSDKADAVEFLPARDGGIADFLRGLDCYYYNTSTWIEPWGRAVVEAMACGLPVVANAVGGYAQIIRHGENGLLFRDASEAATLVRGLAVDPGLRRRLGAEARRTAEELLGPAAMARLVAFYLARG